MIKCIVFDVGGVLKTEKIEPVHNELNKNLGKEIFVRKGKFHKRLLKGQITQRQYFTMLSKKADVTALKMEKMFIDSYTTRVKPNAEVVEIARRLKKRGYKTAILSNTSPLLKKINKKHGTYRGFSPVVLSCDINSMKPEKSIFKITLQKANCKPEEAVFVEDREEFIAVPKKLGVHTILFKNPSQLRKDLKKLGVRI